MMMNVPVPYLDVKCYFNVRENVAGSEWKTVDNFAESLQSKGTVGIQAPAWHDIVSYHHTGHRLSRLFQRGL